MPEWLWIIVVGGVVMGLVGFISKEKLKEISELFTWKSNLNKKGGVMTKNEHGDFCKAITQSISRDMKDQSGEFKQIMCDQFTGFKEWMGVYVENTVLKEIKSMNGNNNKPLSIKRKRK